VVLDHQLAAQVVGPDRVLVEAPLVVVLEALRIDVQRVLGDLTQRLEGVRVTGESVVNRLPRKRYLVTKRPIGL